MIYAKDENQKLTYPDPAEFPGIPNALQCEPALRAAGYLPLIGDAEDREGYTATPAAWHVETMAMTRVEPRQVAPGSVEMVDTEITLDASYIQVDEWAYTEAPEEPEEGEDESSSHDVEPIDPADLENLPKLFSKWELIMAWEATGDINGVLAQAKNDTTLLAAWSSLPDQIDMADLLTQWAERVALYAGGRQVHKENIIKWLQWIKQEREKGMENE